MKKKLGLLCICAMLLAGCGTPKLSNGEEAVVSFGDGDMISVDELYEEMKNDYALNTLITLVDLHIFESAFEDFKEDAKAYAESMVQATIENYGGEEQFLTILQQSGYATVDAYQEYIYLSYLQSHAIEEYSKLIVTDDEIEDYYENKAQGDVEISHILITPQVTEGMSEDEIEAAEDTAYAKVEDLINQLKKADDVAATFEELAKENSEDEATASKGGSLGKFTYGDLDASYDELLDAAYKTKDGQIYTKVITTELGYHVILKTASYEKESLEDLEEEIREILAENLLENDKDISVTALEYYREEAGLKIEDSELKSQYDKYIQNILSQYNSTETESE